MTEHDSVCIVGAKRTPQGRFLGALAKCSAVELGVQAARAALQAAHIEPGRVDLTIIGNVLSAGLGQNIARQVALGSGVPEQAPAFAVNMMCASGLQAVVLAAQAIRSGEANVVLCGGAESMSNAPYLLDRARGGYKLGDGVLIDSLLRDGLVDAFCNRHMGECVEELARERGLSRQQQDAFALRSQQRHAEARQRDVFAAEIAAVGDLEHDEHPRPDTSLEQLAALRPVFDKQGTITAGNASGINDGAAMLVLCTQATAQREGWRPLAKLAASASAGCEPGRFGLGPVHAIRRLCERIRCEVNVFDLVELNEAFAAQSLACLAELKLDEAKVNPHGGAIAMGHPIGASGARLAVHLAHQLAAGRAGRALASLCVGGGMGIVAALEAADT